MISCDLGIIEPDRFLQALQKARRNEEVPSFNLTQTLELESWLRHLAIHGVLKNTLPAKKLRYSPSLQAGELHAPTLPKGLAS